MVLTFYYRTRIREEYSATNCPEGRNVPLKAGIPYCEGVNSVLLGKAFTECGSIVEPDHFSNFLHRVLLAGKQFGSFFQPYVARQFEDAQI